MPTNEPMLLKGETLSLELLTRWLVVQVEIQKKQFGFEVTWIFGFQEEFCYPVECLALTVEEVMHIRQVLVKAELEKYQQYKDVYTALKKGKV